MILFLFIIPVLITAVIVALSFLRKYVTQSEDLPPSLLKQLFWVVAVSLGLACIVAPSRAAKDMGYVFLEVIALPAPGYFIAIAFAPLIWHRHAKASTRISLAIFASILLLATLWLSDRYSQLLKFSGGSGIFLYVYWVILIMVNAFAMLQSPRSSKVE